METADFFDVVKRRRSIRRFKPDPVPDEYLEKILDASRHAMSGANGQPWEFVVVRNPETRSKLADIIAQRTIVSAYYEETRPEELRHPGVGRRTNFNEEVPVIIVVCGDPRTFQASVLIANFYTPEQHHFHMNYANATQVICLAAAALGLGSLWCTVFPPYERQVKDLLKIPEMLRVYTLVPIGYPAYEPAPSYRRELGEIVHYEEYDQDKFRSDEDIWKFLADLRKGTAPHYRPGSAKGQ